MGNNSEHNCFEWRQMSGICKVFILMDYIYLLPLRSKQTFSRFFLLLCFFLYIYIQIITFLFPVCDFYFLHFWIWCGSIFYLLLMLLLITSCLWQKDRDWERKKDQISMLSGYCSVNVRKLASSVALLIPSLGWPAYIGKKWAKVILQPGTVFWNVTSWIWLSFVSSLCTAGTQVTVESLVILKVDKWQWGQWKELV